MQIYKDMDIGSAKPTKDEREKAVHHLIDFVSPDKRYSVADFKRDASNKIERIIEENKTPIIVGGTGLYIDSLVYNIEFNEEKTDLEYRELLDKEETSRLYDLANKIDEISTKKISKNDRKRLMRIIEIYHSTGKTKYELEEESRKKVKYDYRIFILNMEREKLYVRINQRVDKMIEEGLIDEVKKLLEKYKEFPTAMQGLGYKETVQYLRGELTKEEMIDKIKQESRRYAKRQLTWFRRYKNAVWLDAKNSNNANIIMEDIGEEK